ncbi:MAG: phosphate starvation-inducible protein PhoH, partial [Methylobacteriaceae bacterium]|nr:phosphate starvation-inducible protein PhoH [Methylobacteriaceae bacterium]
MRAPVIEPAAMPAIPGVDESAEVTLTFADNRLAGLLFGHYDQHLAHIERRLGVTVNALGNRVVVKGPPDLASRTRAVLETLYERVRLEGAITLGDVDGAIQESALQGNLFPTASPPAAPRPSFEQISTRKRGP